ncbi:MAG TPA: arylamine N-acetyltransferase [Gaiellales bacterium]|nr:arylamine N-acetyltransferase [Gaiellales bacterium]
MDADRYLERIGYEGGRDPSPRTLAALQRAHMLAVPFENLDIQLGRRLVLDPEANYRKIVERSRGGWCFELNGLFAGLLETLGFEVTLLGSRVHGTDWVSQDLAHLLLLVHLDEPWVADVGFGAGQEFEPVRLAELPDRVIPHADGLSVHFSTEPRAIDDFQQVCDELQTSPDSGFVRTRVAHRAVPGGRISLRELTLTEQVGERSSERELSGEEEWRVVLRERFDLILD